MNDFAAILISIFCSLGFAIVFNVRKEKLFFAALGGGVSWAVYLLTAHHIESVFVLNMLATIAGAMYSELMARVEKAPVTIFLISSIIPLVPGSGLYYTMEAFVSRDEAQFVIKGSETALVAGAIAFGILLVTAMMHVEKSIVNYCRKELKHS